MEHLAWQNSHPAQWQPSKPVCFARSVPREVNDAFTNEAKKAIGCTMDASLPAKVTYR